MIPNIAVPIKSTPLAPADALETHTAGRSASKNAERIKDLGFTASKQIKIYGQRYELVSDPFEEGECTSVRVVSENDRTVRTLRLPAAILIGLSDRFRKPVRLPSNEHVQFEQVDSGLTKQES